MQKEDQLGFVPNKKLLQIQELIKKKKQQSASANNNKNQQNSKRVKAGGQGIYSGGKSRLDELDEEQIMMQEASKEELDPNDPNIKHKLKYEDAFDDEFEKEIIEDNIENEESDDDDYESIELEETDGFEKKKVLFNKKKQDITADTKRKQKTVPYMGSDKQLNNNEYLDYDNSAYMMLHRATTEWPCLSCDFLSGQFRQDFNYPQTSQFCRKDLDYPLDLMAVAGSQASLPSKNKIYVMRMANLLKTHRDDDPEADQEDEEKLFNEGNPIILHASIPIKGGINRIRAMQGYPLIATWCETRQVKIFDVGAIAKQLKDADITDRSQRKPRTENLGAINNFKSGCEGYGLDWSPLKPGLLASGNMNGTLQLYQASDETCSNFTRLGSDLNFHQDSLEDIQFCPNEKDTLATCSVDGTINFIDLRSLSSGPRLTIEVADVDVNVISWNKVSPNLIAAGLDDGSFKVYDLRHPAEDPITYVRWHEDQITSIQWQPDDKWTLAVASADNRLSIWDFSIEGDDDEMDMQDEGAEVPEQIIFLHQGQDDIKELRWSPGVHNTLMSTALSGFNLFQPGTDQSGSAMLEDEDFDDNELDLIPDQIQN